MARYMSATIAIIQVSTTAIVIFIAFAGNLGSTFQQFSGGRTLLSIGLAGLFFATLLGIIYILLSTYMILKVYVLRTARIYPQTAKDRAKTFLRWDDSTWVTISVVAFSLMITSFVIGMGSLSAFAYRFILQ